MTTTHVRVRTLVAGDVFSSGGQVTMVGPSSARPGEMYVAARMPDGNHWGTHLAPSALVEVATP